MTKEKWADLHVHTTHSDGLFTPEQVIQKAQEKGLAAVGIVDHDTISGIPEALEASKHDSIEVVAGVELSSQYDGRDIHILGYYIELDNPQLLDYLNRFRKERVHRAEKMVKNLNDLGIHISMGEVEEKSGGTSIGRPHLAEVLMEKGFVETFQEAFQRYLGYGSKAYEEKYRINPEEAIALISEANGLSFLAHPGNSMSNEFIFHFIKAGLDGIEIVHPNIPENRTQQLQQLVQSYNLLVCGGSDCHGGRSGYVSLGDYNIPYACLEDMQKVLRVRKREK
jgi:predicted metal-dependent phosphoesterase TrpH